MTVKGKANQADSKKIKEKIMTGKTYLSTAKTAIKRRKSGVLASVCL